MVTYFIVMLLIIAEKIMKVWYGGMNSSILSFRLCTVYPGLWFVLLELLGVASDEWVGIGGRQRDILDVANNLIT
jgi:hypothetical protein